MRATDIYRLMEKYSISAKKHLGQNFLADDRYIGRIIEAAGLSRQCGVIEIGPGLGSLTNRLTEQAGHVISYEIDPEMVRILKENLNSANLTLIQGDFLKADVARDISNHLGDFRELAVVANLPYYITTAILIKILEERLPVDRMIVMMQKEVADRLAGKPATKDYNALSVLVQYYTDVRKLFDISPEAFIPRPDVVSTVVCLKRKQGNTKKPADEEFFLKFNRIIFSQRRKTLVNNINKELGIDKETIKSILEENGFDSNIRAESLSVDDIIRLSDAFLNFTEGK